MNKTQSTGGSRERSLDLDELRREAAHCRACDLWRNATQTVFGKGAPNANVMLVGEQPGNYEDLAGEPFVGPAGRLLDKALAQAGIDPLDVYITNAVKHFKWTRRGKLRIHKKPNAEEITACKPWLEAEIAAIRPTVIVALGATAAQALLGRTFRLTHSHGQFFARNGAPAITATLHPSAVLRALSAEDRERMLAQLVEDLKGVARRL